MFGLNKLTTFAAVLSVLGSASMVAAAPTAAPLEARAATFTGQATYYAVGLGACGNTNSDSEMVVALNGAQYQANNGAECGKSLSITNPANGKSASATVVDMCPGCASGSLDMSPTLFQQLASGGLDEGVFPISWEFTS